MRHKQMASEQDKTKTSVTKTQFEPNDKVSVPFSGTSGKDFQSYKPARAGIQAFGTRKKFHKGVDYGSGLTYVDSAGKTRKVGLGTPVKSMMSGEVTLLPSYFTGDGVTDYGIAVRSKDPNGKDVTVVYGHLSKESVQAAFGADKVKQAINSGGSLGRVERGKTIGAIGSTGGSSRTGNEPHVHISVYKGDTPVTTDRSKMYNPTEYFKGLTLTEDKQQSKSGKSDTEVAKTDLASTQSVNSNQALDLSTLENGTTTSTQNGNVVADSSYQSTSNNRVSDASEVSKVVTLLKENAAEVKKQYGLDVTTDEGLGKAVMQYWKENNLDPKTLKEQLPSLKDSKTASSAESSDTTKSNTDLSNVVTLLKDNATEVKKQYGLDVTSEEGLGKAVMQYWKENNLDPKALKEQLPSLKESEFSKVSTALTDTKTTETTKNKQLVLN
jgi:murein DD-endopeptidase MepM/ murein hydrolase activator NlpD